MSTDGRIFSPANQLTDEIKELGAKLLGVPSWALFPKWYRAGGSLWLTSSSGSTLLTVDFTSATVTLSERTAARLEADRVVAMPEHWGALYLGSLFNPIDGSAMFPELYEQASAAWVRGRRSEVQA